MFGTKLNKISIAQIYIIVIPVFLLSSVMSTDAVVDENTVAVWLFEEGSGPIVRDASGNGHDGEFTGSLNRVKTKFGEGIQFPGDDSGYIVVDSTSKLELETFSIEVLVKITDHAGKWQGIVCKQQQGCVNRNYGIWVHVDQRVLHGQIGANGNCAFNINGTTTITDSVWHYLAFTFDGKTGRLYVGGVLETEQENSNTFQSNDPITIGVPNKGNAAGLIGIIEEIRISNIARSETEIKEVMSVGLAQILSVDPESKLTTRWGYIKQVQ